MKTLLIVLSSISIFNSALANESCNRAISKIFSEQNIKAFDQWAEKDTKGNWIVSDETANSIKDQIWQTLKENFPESVFGVLHKPSTLQVDSNQDFIMAYGDHTKVLIFRDGKIVLEGAPIIPENKGGIRNLSSEFKKYLGMGDRYNSLLEESYIMNNDANIPTLVMKLPRAATLEINQASYGYYFTYSGPSLITGGGIIMCGEIAYPYFSNDSAIQ